MFADLATFLVMLVLVPAMPLLLMAVWLPTHVFRRVVLVLLVIAGLITAALWIMRYASHGTYHNGLASAVADIAPLIATIITVLAILEFFAFRRFNSYISFRRGN